MCEMLWEKILSTFSLDYIALVPNIGHMTYKFRIVLICYTSICILLTQRTYFTADLAQLRLLSCQHITQDFNSSVFFSMQDFYFDILTLGRNMAVARIVKKCKTYLVGLENSKNTRKQQLFNTNDQFFKICINYFRSWLKM